MAKLKGETIQWPNKKETIQWPNKNQTMQWPNKKQRQCNGQIKSRDNTMAK